MPTTAKEVTELLSLVTTHKSRFDAAVEAAESRLESARVEHARRISESAGRIARMESDLEFFEALEQERLARQTRTELAAAIEEHKQVVAGADRALKDAMRRYLHTIREASRQMLQDFTKTAGFRE